MVFTFSSVSLLWLKIAGFSFLPLQSASCHSRPSTIVPHLRIQLNLGSKIFRKRNSRKFPKAKIEFADKYLHSIYIALGSISNLGMI